jgi:hypothetical protein
VKSVNEYVPPVSSPVKGNVTWFGPSST